MITLPDFARFAPDKEAMKDESRENLVKTMLGWDVTDFGSDDFAHCGVFCVQLAAEGADGKPDLTVPVTVYRDGIRYEAKPGEVIEISTGNSITLCPHVYHRFFAKPGAGDRLVCFHVGENNRTCPGRGHLDWNEIFGTLREVGRSIAVWRDLVDDKSEAALDAEAAYILDFMKKA